jgi:hypothetical protein
MKITHRLFIIFTLLFCPVCCLLTAQNTATQTVKGTVVEKDVQAPLVGANIVLVGSMPLIGTTSDENGRFRLGKIPLGRQTFQVSFVGYDGVFLKNIVVIAGKELDLTVEMTPSVFEQNAVVISSKNEKRQPINELSLVSTRQISVEETQRFAASINDPLRMVTSLAGVRGGGEGNEIIIRGNAPNGLLWRLEGIDIPNPNHFANVGTSAGGISILSAQLLANSDFSTGAFAAEYGNALSGVFDLKLRKGNRDKREFTIGTSFIGLDAAAEGYIKKGYGGSFLGNFRFSTLTLLQKTGVYKGEEPTQFQDFSFNIFLPTQKMGTFTIFGLGGDSKQYQNAKRDTTAWKTDPNSRWTTLFQSKTGVVGLTHSVVLNKKTSLKTVVAASGYQFEDTNDYLESLSKTRRTFDHRFSDTKLSISTVLNHRFNPKWLLRTGVYATSWGFDFLQAQENAAKILVPKIKDNGTTSTTNAFAQFRGQITEGVVFIGGFHVLRLCLNGATSFEPRAAVSVKISGNQSLSLGYGRHSQVQPLGVYFAKIVQNNVTTTPNQQLGFTKADHFVLSHDYFFSKNGHFKTEIYYQKLSNVPITAGRATNFSLINVKQGFSIEPLVNNGKGENYGVEMTFEQALSAGFYCVVSGSLFDSKYKASDNKWYNSRFNANSTSSITAGKEWYFKKEMTNKTTKILRGVKNRTLAMDIKLNQFGGERVNPIDLAESIKQKKTILKPNAAFAERLPDYFRTDFRISWRRDYKQFTSTLFIDIQNVTNHQNVFRQYFDVASNSIKSNYRQGLIPIFGWKAEF